MVICCIISYFVVVNTEFAQYYIRKSGAKTGVNKDEEERVKFLGNEDPDAPDININRTPTASAISTNSHLDSSDYSQVPSPPQPKTFMGVYSDVMIMAIQVLTCFIITFVVFPGTSLSTGFDFLGDSPKDLSWFAVLMITIFNVFDTIGRFAGGYKQIFTPFNVIILTVIRLIFIPTFVLIQLNADPAWLFQSDWFRILNMALFALTNGYNSTLLMIYGPTLAKDADKERAGLIMSFHLVGGIFIGALIAGFAMDKI